MLVAEIVEVLRDEHEDEPIFTDDERAEVRGLIKKAKTYADLSAIRNTWTIKRDQRIPKPAVADDDFEDDIPGESE